MISVNDLYAELGSIIARGYGDCFVYFMDYCQMKILPIGDPLLTGYDNEVNEFYRYSDGSDLRANSAIIVSV